MLLAVDIGNSHTVAGLFKAHQLVTSWRIQTNRKSTSDELASTLMGLFNMRDVRFEDVSGLIIASVVPQLLASWLTFGRTLVRRPLVVDHTTDTGIRIITDTPSEVGADRVVNAAAAFQKYKTALIIVDFGTAITFDCVSGKGEYMGGAITPGLGISLEALGQQTAKLPQIDISIPPQKAIGTNTIEAIKSGILFGYGCMVDGLISKMRADFLTSHPKVIATGGMAQLISSCSREISSVEPNLTLEGLALIFARNHEDTP